MFDYLIIGSGLAGMAMAETLQSRGHRICVFDDSSRQASLVAAGLYNPVVLKRLNLTWEGGRLMDFSIPFYQRLQEKLGGSFDEKLPILRRFASAEEQNAWFEAADRPGLSRFLSPRLLRNDNPGLDAPFGFGEVLETGRLHTAKLLTAYRSLLHRQGALRAESFDHGSLRLYGEEVAYGDIKSRYVVFCEGFGMRANPFFRYLPLQGSKGELLTVRIPGLGEGRIIKSGVFLIPEGNDRYRVGATYGRNDFSPEPTPAAREELTRKLGHILKVDFEVENQSAGIRPTVPDRRPLAGRHPEHPRLLALNGMGSRGVLLAPYAAACLADFVESGTPLPPEIDLARYGKFYGKSPG
ncbi:FAD-binding oxidoreductase [Robiginitalea sp. SC105]|uniref:NAD(P)/FAD-dependent oxidoreductase n=1 Tax=Robiginitalea sp. SC105 TaxID=2762332 RepID=UPI00163A3E49|nr:FAD-dependent oxidoreductase [Robiginitalea sp. SC105]MBC2837767.1 FAD-binding oxidoreductase [Robiginitalea sp. SC105]